MSTLSPPAPPHVLIAGVWTLDPLERYDRHGQSLGPLSLEVPVGSMTGLPLAQFTDGDGDGDVDDFAAFQDELTGVEP